MSFETWIIFCITDTLLCVTPGPGVMLIVSLALKDQRQAGSSAIAGILTASLAYFFLAAIGLTSIMAASTKIFLSIKYIGASYLIWLGLQIIRTSKKHTPAKENSLQKSKEFAFWRGFFIHGFNPKVFLFFCAVLPQFLDLKTAFDMQLVILGSTALTIQAVVLFSYLILTEKSKAFIKTSIQDAIQNIGGIFMIAVGASIAFIDKHPTV